MLSLFRKDFYALFSSAVAFVVVGLFTTVLALFLWIIPGEYNLVDGGLVVTNPIFHLLSLLMLFFIPLISMRSFTDEKRQGTWDMICIRPISSIKIVFAKYLSIQFFLLIFVVLTFVHPVVLSRCGYPSGNLDIGVLIASYLGLLLLTSAYVVIGVFASAISPNQIVAFLIALFVNLFVTYGFELLGGISSLSFLQNVTDFFSLSSRYRSFQRGVIDSGDMVYFIFITGFFLILTAQYIGKKFFTKAYLYSVSAFGFIALLSMFFYFRADLTEEKRYTISEYTKSVLTNLKSNVEIKIYLAGDLNIGFSRLRNGVGELIDECRTISDVDLNYQYINPSDAQNEGERESHFRQMIAKGMEPVSVNETDRTGKTTQKLLFPWVEMIVGKDTLRFSMLKKVPGKTSQESLNASLESLEMSLADGLRALTRQNPVQIAFLEGHGELPDVNMVDVLDKLGKSYRIDRGVIGNNPAILSPYKVLIIAGPKSAFSETDKFVLDQYLMGGGRIFWLVDGANISHEDLENKGQSTAFYSDLNLTDMFFGYGVRINPVLIQDAQCISIPMKSKKGMEEAYPIPWIYAPTLIPSPRHLITQHSSLVKADYSSSMDVVGENSAVHKEVLLATSSHTRQVGLPHLVSYKSVMAQLSDDYFNQGSTPVALLLEGTFSSLYRNRFIPDGLSGQTLRTESEPTKMVIAASSSIIRNELRNSPSGVLPVPLGYVPFMNVQFGNPDFVVNVVQYLADDQLKIILGSRQFILRLMDSKILSDYLIIIQITVVILPLVLLSVFILLTYYIRKRRYSHF